VNIIRRVIVHGRVQGVGYRAFVEAEAIRRGIAGYVRNRRDGTVEAVFEGEVAAVAEMVAVCRRGPRGAQIDTIDEREGNAADLASRDQGVAFTVLPTV